MESENGTRVVQTMSNGMSLIEDPLTNSNGLSIQSEIQQFILD